jgi:hypothetical protein
MDNLGQIIAWGATVLAGIGVIAAFVKKYLGKVKKIIAIATEFMNVVNNTIIAVEPDADGKITITVDEVSKIAESAKRFAELLKKK